MSLTLVTGSNGFIGSHVVRALIKSNQPVRALIYPGSDRTNLKGLNVEIFEADLRNRSRLEAAFVGVDTIFHLAAYNHMTAKSDDIYEEVNVLGTAILCDLALEHKVKRFIHTSSATVIPIPDSGVGTENTSGLSPQIAGPYERSKLLAEKEVQKRIDRGLDAVIVNPTVPVGPGDVNLSAPGRLILDFTRKKIPAYFETGMNLIAVQDVAAGHLLAQEKGRRAERYILGNKNLYLSEVFEMLSKITGTMLPKRKIPYWVALSVANLSHFGARAIGGEPGISLEGVKLAKKPQFFDCSKAQSELGLPKSDVFEALKQEVEWFKKEGYL